MYFLAIYLISFNAYCSMKWLFSYGPVEKTSQKQHLQCALYVGRTTGVALLRWPTPEWKVLPLSQSGGFAAISTDTGE